MFSTDSVSVLQHIIFLRIVDVGRKGDKDARPGPVLSWTRRVKIAVGAAKGLEYLHEKAEKHIIHRYIKSSNILLFDDDVSKIADFDLSNQAPDEVARVHSTRVLGTFGYYAPEYVIPPGPGCINSNRRSNLRKH